MASIYITLYGLLVLPWLGYEFVVVKSKTGSVSYFLCALSDFGQTWAECLVMEADHMTIVSNSHIATLQQEAESVSLATGF